MRKTPPHTPLPSLSFKNIVILILCCAISWMRPDTTYAQSSNSCLLHDPTMLWYSDPEPYYYDHVVSHAFKPRKQNKYNKLPKTKVNPSGVKEHPRKRLLEEAPLHTQRAWLYSAVIPGLGQYYNDTYWWKVPVMYTVFGLLTYGAIYNHNEYMTTRREILKENTKNQNLKNYMQGRERDRTIFLAAIVVWYVLNVFDAYVEGTLKTFDVSDDLSIIIEEPTNTPKTTGNAPMATGVSLNISLQPKNKDEDRSDWIW